MRAEKEHRSGVNLRAQKHLKKGCDWSQDVFMIAHNSEFISKIQFKPIKIDVNVYQSDINYFKKVNCNFWCRKTESIKTLFKHL